RDGRQTRDGPARPLESLFKHKGLGSHLSVCVAHRSQIRIACDTSTSHAVPPGQSIAADAFRPWPASLGPAKCCGHLSLRAWSQPARGNRDSRNVLLILFPAPGQEERKRHDDKSQRCSKSGDVVTAFPRHHVPEEENGKHDDHETHKAPF